MTGLDIVVIVIIIILAGSMGRSVYKAGKVPPEYVGAPILEVGKHLLIRTKDENVFKFDIISKVPDTTLIIIETCDKRLLCRVIARTGNSITCRVEGGI